MRIKEKRDVGNKRFAGHAFASDGNFCLEFPLGGALASGASEAANCLFFNWLSMALACFALS